MKLINANTAPLVRPDTCHSKATRIGYRNRMLQILIDYEACSVDL